MAFPFRNTATRYGLGGRLLHWTSVTLLLVLILTADGFAGLEAGADRDRLVGIHVSWGLLFLLVMLLRVYWRCSNLNPVSSYSIRNWQKFTARVLHLVIYVVVITQALSGLLNLVSDGAGIMFFSVFRTASFMEEQPALHAFSTAIHYALSIVIYPLIGIHISAAIYHQLFGVLDDEEE